MGSRDRFRNGLDQIRIERPGFGQMVDGLAFVEAAHFDGIFDRFSLAVDLERSVAILRDRDHAVVDLRREPAVYFDLFVAGGLALLKRRIVEKGKTNGAFDLERAAVLEKNRRRMGIDAMNMRMCRGIGQEGKHFLLHAGVVWC